jgi:uncharacterized protein YoxC
VTDWQLIFLGVMAVSLVLMAVAQLVVALALVKSVKKVAESVDQLQRDIRPVLDKAARIADDASRVASLALVQVERLDFMMKSSAARVDETFQFVQRSIAEPIRHGSALLSALRAAFSVVRAWQARPSTAPAMGEDDDPLFVG